MSQITELYEELREQYNVVVGTSNNYAEEVLELKDQIEKLKDERKKLEEEMGHLCNEEDAKEHWGLVDGTELVEEKEEYKLIIDGLGTMVENIDQNACDVFNKLTQEYRNQFDEVHHK